ncbi:hypothetical protein ACFWYW_28785 [Nonomuraea sp. NPDC059023]|uniref:hypothetical protein n=1 Tax=unclassified Nonomuraea TaxID=2593643 RepID=UPI0036BB1BB6
MMYPDLYLFVEGVRGRELREAAARQRRARAFASASVVSVFEEQLGWALVRAGLRLLDRHACRPNWSPFAPHR